MKATRVLLLLLLCASAVFPCFSQTTIGRQKVDQYPTTAWNTMTYGLTWLPSDYDSTNTRYPLILFLHGRGETGDGINGLYTLVTQGLPLIISNGFDPQAVNPADGKNYKFIVVSPQAPSASQWSYGFGAIQYILPDVISRYRIDTSRIYVTGLSAGGSGTLASVTNGPLFAKKISAIVPICAAGTNSQSEMDQIPLIGGTYGVKVWYPCGANDSWITFATSTVNTINNASPAPQIPAVLTALPGVGHEPAAWNTVYDPLWRTNEHNRNIYEWMLQYSRPLSSPTANAGADRVITLPVDSVLLSGSGTAGAGGVVSSYRWTKITGPAQDTLLTPDSSSTLARNLQEGAYTYQFTIIDNSSATASDTVRITVQAAVNLLPVVNAGSDRNISLPTDSLQLNGIATDPDGSIVSYGWKKIAGPSCRIVDSASASTKVLNLLAGSYSFELSAVDNSGGSGRDTINVMVRTTNQPPVANAGPDREITLPLDSVVLQGMGSDPDGGALAFAWKKISGPVAGVISDSAKAQPIVSGLLSGSYIFRLTVTDSAGASDADTVSVIVRPAAVSATGCQGVKRYMLPTEDGGKYLNANPADFWYERVNPGDTLVLESKFPWSYFSMEGYSGTAACPIVIMNEGGQTWLTSGIFVKNSQHVKITGSGHAGTFYGFRVYNPAVDQNGVAVCITGKTRVVEVERVDVYKKTYGVWAKQDPQCDTSYNYPNYTMDSIEIHHSRFKNIGQDCIYAGNTDPLGTRTYWCDGVARNFIPMRLSNINIHHLIIDSCNRTGIQLGGANSGYNQIHDNLITRCGYEYNQWQGTGIAIGGMTRNCHVYNNTIKNTFLYGIMSFGVGTNYIENNMVDSTGYLNGQPNLGSRPCNILASPKETIPFDSTTVIIRNNKLGLNSTVEDYNIQVVTWGPPTWTVNNVVCSNTRLDGRTPAHLYIDPSVTCDTNCRGIVSKFPPLVKAGADTTLLPASDSLLLRGMVTDTDGTIISLQWTMISGPSPVIFGTASNDTTLVSGLLPGTYVFRLTAIDNDSLQSSDDVEVRLQAANLPPMVNAGMNRWITLPLNQVSMAAGGYDVDGLITTYQWNQLAGPSIATIANPADPLTTIGNLIEGVYRFELVATDNAGASGRDTMQVYVYPAPPPTNQAPVASAGADMEITLPVNSALLNGSAADADGTIASYLWTKVSGPAGSSIANPAQAQTGVNDLVAGTYVFELAVTDNQGARSVDQVTVLVHPAPNSAPMVTAGADKTITLPLNSVTLSGVATDPDGIISLYQWTQISGPGAAVLGSSSQAQTTVNGLVQGVYQFVLSVTDNAGATRSDSVFVTVLPAVNQPPLADAGPDQTLLLPASSVTLSGTGSDADGAVVSYRWTISSGPGGAVIANPNTEQTTVSGLVQGVYEFVLTATDNAGATGRDTMLVNVMAQPPAGGNAAPVVSAGMDKIITLPVDAVTLSGAATDQDGTVVSYQWKRISGPVFFILSSGDQPQTVVSKMMKGVYQFELSATDNLGAVGRDTVMVTVNEAAYNLPPVAEAGNSQRIVLPVQSTLLEGSGYDPDGTVVAYQWSKISGPSGESIGSSYTGQTQVSGLQEGTYAFELTLTDDLGAQGKDTVYITVSRDNRLTSTASIYPNPVSSTLNVKIDAVTHRNQTRIRIYDMRGMLVHDEEFLRAQQVVVEQIDVTRFKPGAYLAVIEADINEVITLKFIKE